MLNWLLAVLVVATPQQPSPTQDTAIDPEVRARFRVVVTADLTLSRQVYDYLALVAARNTSWQRLGKSGRTPEAELVRLITTRATYPAYRRDPGIVMLRFDMSKERVSVEYCLKRCTEPNAELAVYSTSMDAFLTTLQKNVESLERYRKERGSRP